MSANTLLTSTVTGGVNSHTTTAEEANALSTDFVTQGVVGAITLNTGSGGTGSFCVNADGTPDMGVAIKAGQAYVTATPSSQNSQVLRVRASSDYTAYTINANSSGSTKYDWIYLSISATNANAPSSDGSNVASFVTSRSSSNTTDNGTPPTYGLLLAIVTVANAASSITNSNITDKRFNTSIGAQNGSLIVTQNGTGTDAKVQAAGIDANVNLGLTPKGTGSVILPTSTTTNFAGLLGYAQITTSFTTTSTTAAQVTGLTITVTIPAGGRKIKITAFTRDLFNTGNTSSVFMSIWDGTVGSGTQLNATIGFANGGASAGIAMAVVTPAAGSKTYNIGLNTAGSGTAQIEAGATFPAFILVEAS